MKTLGSEFPCEASAGKITASGCPDALSEVADKEAGLTDSGIDGLGGSVWKNSQANLKAEQDLDIPAVGLLYKGMRILSAVILILWTVCFGRCLADQYGLLQPETQAVCEHSCCQPESDENQPSPPTTTCEVCEFVKSGGSLPGQLLVLGAPQLIDFTLPEFHWLILRVVMTEVEAAEVAALDTSQPRIVRLCEWMSSTAAPVRGPNA